MEWLTNEEEVAISHMNDDELEKFFENKDELYRFINYIDKNKKATFMSRQGKFTVEYLGGYLYTITVHYAHDRKLMISAKTLYQYLKEHEDELSIIKEVNK